MPLRRAHRHRCLLRNAPDWRIAFACLVIGMIRERYQDSFGPGKGMYWSNTHATAWMLMTAPTRCNEPADSGNVH